MSIQVNKNTSLSSLPNEVIQDFTLSFCDSKALHASSQTCNQIYQLSKGVWNQKYYKEAYTARSEAALKKQEDHLEFIKLQKKNLTKLFATGAITRSTYRSKMEGLFVAKF